MDTLPMHWRDYVKEYTDTNLLIISHNEIWEHISEWLTTWEIPGHIQTRIKQELCLNGSNNTIPEEIGCK